MEAQRRAGAQAGRPELQDGPSSRAGDEGGRPAVPRPRPGGAPVAPGPDASPSRRPEAPEPAAGAPAAAPAAAPGDLLALAMPLLQLMARLRGMAARPDVAALRERAEAELHGFNRRAEAAGVPAAQRARAEYVLCAGLDDLVLNTPWGARGAWAEHPLLPAFQPAVPAERFFDLLRQTGDKVAELRPVLALMHACLSLGVLGPLRAEPARAEEARARAAAILEGSGPPVPQALAGQVAGVSAPVPSRGVRLPVWVAAALGLAAVGALYAALLLRLNERGDAVFAGLLAAPPAHMPVVTRLPVPVAPPPGAEAAAMAPGLQEQLRARLAPLGTRVALAGTAATPVLRLPERELFASRTGATLRPGAAALLDAVAAALRSGLEPPPAGLLVAAYADDRPVRGVLFPSAFALTSARAAAVRAALARALGTRPAVTAQGRGDAEPLASDATEAGRELNRRVELTLDAAGSGS